MTPLSAEDKARFEHLREALLAGNDPDRHLGYGLIRTRLLGHEVAAVVWVSELPGVKGGRHVQPLAVLVDLEMFGWLDRPDTDEDGAA